MNGELMDSMKEKLKILIDRYNNTLRNASYSDISEETVRTWINEFLSIFGWDVQNTNHVLQERVLQGTHYERLKAINSPHRKPDYIFLNGTNIKSFLDAKNLTVDIFTNRETAYQIRSYGWSAKVPCAFVTNFQQFVIYDTRFIPEPSQEANVGTIQLDVNEYIEKFDILYEHLCYDNICANKLEDLYKVTAIEGKNQVDSEFMSILSEFRYKLASDIYLNNKTFIKNDAQLNYYTQVILDRIVFIRVCESKGIEKQEKLKDFINSEDGFWNSFKESCYMEFYMHYDGAMFSRDESFQKLQLSNYIFKDFVEKLYYPFPYRFDVIPVKVIANIYEEFLGHQIIISESGISEVMKEEYIRSNGAVATPEHIVDIICKQTIDLSEIDTVQGLFNIKILDPCCGSGVFIVSCYEQLAKKMIQILKDNKQERDNYPDYYFMCNEQMLLTIVARRKIITSCIYGIDCDEAAIEVTKMSLALKIVDGNNSLAWEGVGAFDERVLREISKNIKLGNTLVDVDGHFDTSQIMDIKPFNVRSTFETVFKAQKGFSYIIGNPPYVETKHYKAAQPIMHDYLREKYSTFEGKADLAVLFIERSMQLLNEDGKLGFIIQRRWFKTDYGKPTRRLICYGKYLDRLIDFKATNIFKGRIVYASIIVLNKAPRDFIKYYYMPYEVNQIKRLFENSSSNGEFEGCEFTTIPYNTSIERWNFEQYNISKLVEKYTEKWGTLSQYPHLVIKDGIQALWKKIYHLRNVKFENNIAIGTNGFNEIVKVEKDILRGVIYNREFYPFKNVEPEAYCIFPYEGASNDTIPFSEIKTRYPLAYQYLSDNEDRIKNNVRHREGNLWHTFTREHNHSMYYVDKIIVPMTAKDTIATYMKNTGLYMDNANVWFISVLGASESIMKAITCIINSTIFSVLGKAGANPQANGYYKFNKQFLAPIPFPSSKVIDSQEVNRLSSLYEDISELQQYYLNATPLQKGVLSTTLKEKWKEVDEISYDLYEINNDERKLISSVGRTVDRIELLGGTD